MRALLCFALLALLSAAAAVDVPAGKQSTLGPNGDAALGLKGDSSNDLPINQTNTTNTSLLHGKPFDFGVVGSASADPNKAHS